MSTDNADDQALIEAHARFVALDQDGMIDAADEFQESAYALGLARGAGKSVFDEAEERAAFENDMFFRGMDFARDPKHPDYYDSPYANGAWHGWRTYAKRKAGAA